MTPPDGRSGPLDPATAAAPPAVTAGVAVDRRPHTLRDHLLAARDWLWRRPWFTRSATQLPVARWIARRRARQMFDLVAGFVYSQVLLAVVRLRVCETLAAGPLTPAALGAEVGLSEDAARRLLDATTALGLTDRRSRGRFGLDELGSALLNTPAVVPLIDHHSLLYADLADPVALLRGESGETAMARYWAYARSARPAAMADESVAPYSELMAASQAMLADDILAAFPPRGVRHWLDVGGGEGVFAAAVARRAPEARVTVFDLPAVAGRARDRLAAAGLGARVEAVGGDFLTDSLPTGADVVSLVRVIHDHDDAVALAILQAARRALAPGGCLLLAEPMAGTGGAEPIGGAYFGFYLLAMGSGRARTPEELRALLARAGFQDARLRDTRQPLVTRLIVARPAPQDADGTAAS